MAVKLIISNSSVTMFMGLAENYAILLVFSVDQHEWKHTKGEQKRSFKQKYKDPFLVRFPVEI